MSDRTPLITRPSSVRWLRLLVPALLIVVALVQQGRARLYQQSSWIGCGFGMFATLDNHTSRFVQAHLAGKGGPRFVAVPEELKPLATRARVLPGKENLQQLATAMYQRLDPPDRAGSLRLELHRVTLDPASNQLRAEPFVMVQVP